ncbi:MAG: ubiquitin-conjugating enzyme E2 [Pirellulaceae bacterium]
MNESASRAEYDWNELQDLASQTGFWSITPLQDDGESLRCFTVHIAGRCIESGGPAASRVAFAENVDLEIELPPGYPEQPPQCSVTTRVFHPNIPADGIVDLRELGIEWHPQVSLDVVLERIWDALRGAIVDLEHPLNIGAGQWYAIQTAATLPVDSRPLVKDTTGNTNIVRYRRRGEPPRELPPTERLLIDGSGPEAGASSIHIIE